MFSGEYPFSGMGRVSISRRFGLPIGMMVAIRKGPGKILTLYSNPANQKKGCLRRIGTCGRISIPPAFRRYAEIENGGIILGSKSVIEIFNKKRWENEKKEDRDELEKNQTALFIKRQQRGSD